VPEWITGGLGAGLIIAAFASSVVRNRLEGEDEDDASGSGADGDEEDQRVASTSSKSE
jgi:hypothetical protein